MISPARISAGLWLIVLASGQQAGAVNFSVGLNNAAIRNCASFSQAPSPPEEGTRANSARQNKNTLCFAHLT